MVFIFGMYLFLYSFLVFEIVEYGLYINLYFIKYNILDESMKSIIEFIGSCEGGIKNIYSVKYCLMSVSYWFNKI